MRRALLLVVLPLAGCSVSNAFFNFPDFQQKDNQTACVDLQNAFTQKSGECSGDFFQRDAEALCPERLNEQDPLCASFFDCQASTLICDQGFVTQDFTICQSEFPGLQCNDPFDRIEVTVRFTLEFSDAADCAEAGVVDFGVGINQLSGLGASFGSIGLCADAPNAFFESKSTFPASLDFVGLDARFDGFGTAETAYVADEVVVELEDFGPDETVDLGVITLSPNPFR